MTRLEYGESIVKNPSNASQVEACKNAHVRYPQGGVGRGPRPGKSRAPISGSAGGPQTPTRPEKHPRIHAEAAPGNRGEIAAGRPPDAAAIGPGAHGPPTATGGLRQ